MAMPVLLGPKSTRSRVNVLTAIAPAVKGTAAQPPAPRRHEYKPDNSVVQVVCLKGLTQDDPGHG